jgi:hypothetical protein
VLLLFLVHLRNRHALNAEGKTVYTVELLIDPNSIDAPPAAPVALPLDERDVLEQQDISPETRTKDFRRYVMDKKAIGFVPKINFAIDLGEHNRQRIDELINEGL